MSRQNIPDVVQAEVVSKTLATTLVGKPSASVKELSELTGLSPWQVKETMKRPDFRKALAEAAEDVCAVARNRLKASMNDIVEKCIRVIHMKLDEGDLEAVKVALKTLGLDQDQGRPVDTTLNVFLPGSKKKEIEVGNE